MSYPLDDETIYLKNPLIPYMRQADMKSLSFRLSSHVCTQNHSPYRWYGSLVHIWSSVRIWVCKPFGFSFLCVASQLIYLSYREYLPRSFVRGFEPPSRPGPCRAVRDYQSRASASSATLLCGEVTVSPLLYDSRGYYISETHFGIVTL